MRYSHSLSHLGVKGERVLYGRMRRDSFSFTCLEVAACFLVTDCWIDGTDLSELMILINHSTGFYAKTFLSDIRQPEADFCILGETFCPHFWPDCLYESKDTKKYKFGIVKAYDKGKGFTFVSGVRCSKTPSLKRHNFINTLPLVLFLLILVSS